MFFSSISLKNAALLLSSLAPFKFKVPILKSHMEREKLKRNITVGKHNRKREKHKNLRLNIIISSDLCFYFKQHFLQTINFLICQNIIS